MPRFKHQEKPSSRFFSSSSSSRMRVGSSSSLKKSENQSMSNSNSNEQSKQCQEVKEQERRTSSKIDLFDFAYNNEDDTGSNELSFDYNHYQDDDDDNDDDNDDESRPPEAIVWKDSSSCLTSSSRNKNSSKISNGNRSSNSILTDDDIEVTDDSCSSHDTSSADDDDDDDDDDGSDSGINNDENNQNTRSISNSSSSDRQNAKNRITTPSNTKSILKEKKNHSANNNNNIINNNNSYTTRTPSTPSNEQIKVSPTLTSSSTSLLGSTSNSSKKKNVRVSFDRGVNFNQKKKVTPVKAKRMTSKKFKKVSSASGSRSRCGRNSTSSSNSSSSTTQRTKKASSSSSSSSSSTVRNSVAKSVHTAISKSSRRRGSSNSSVSRSPSVPQHHSDDINNQQESTIPPDIEHVNNISKNNGVDTTNTFTSTAYYTNPRGLAIDTRVLDTFTGDAIGRTFQSHGINFIRSTFARGLTPTILTTMKFKDDKKKSRTTSSSRSNISGGITNYTSSSNSSSSSSSSQINGTRSFEIKSILVGATTEEGKALEKSLEESSKNGVHNDTLKDLVPLVYIKPPSNIGNLKNRSTVHVPKKLMACDSWRIVGDFVESATNEMSSCNSSRPHSYQGTAPMDITIISNDVAFFTDTNIDTHRRAVTRLWERMRIKFQSNAVRSVKVVAFETKVAALHGPNSPNGSASNDSDSPQCMKTENNDDSTPHRFKVAFCVREIQNHIHKLLEKEFQQPPSIDGKAGMQMNIRFEFKDLNSISFLSIMQEWACDMLMSGTSDMGRICFELPETFDGTQSAISLDLSYSICPYRLDSLMTKVLLDELKELSTSSIEVVQLVPLDSIDLSLIYGMPISAKAGMEGDLHQYKHMQILVSALLDYLGSNDVALVLKSWHSERRSMNDSKLFLLMAQVEGRRADDDDFEAESESSKFHAIGRGMLYHYVDKLEFILEDDVSKGGNRDNSKEDEMSKFSSEYVENSLGLLSCSELAPSSSTQN